MEDGFKLISNIAQPNVTWCESQDLVALHSTNSNLVEIYRITFEIEKIVQKPMTAKISCLKFSKDGSMCLIGLSDGHIGIYKAETLQEI